MPEALWEKYQSTLGVEKTQENDSVRYKVQMLSGDPMEVSETEPWKTFTLHNFDYQLWLQLHHPIFYPFIFFKERRISNLLESRIGHVSVLLGVESLNLLPRILARMWLKH